jgi:thioester reductase-like protein
MKTYFVTGATGTIGSGVVPVLLQDENASVRLLVRAATPTQLAERLEALYAFWEIPADDARRARVRALQGDAELPRFGLPDAEYAALVEQCTHIIHCAGKVRMNLPLDEARQAAVNSARNVADLARACAARGGFQKVEFVSTVGVGGRNPGIIPERWITNPRAFHNTYEQSKAEAEIYIARQIDEGLPITVHRPSMVVGEARTGKVVHFQIFYHLCEFLSGRRTLGLFPRIRNAKLDIVPVDYVATALVWSAGRPDTVGRVLHLCSGPEGAIDIMELRSRVRRAFRSGGVPVPPSLPLPLWLFRAGIPVIERLVSEKARRALRTLPIFFDYLEEDQAFGNSDTRALLGAVGIHLPAVESYVDQLLAYYTEHHPRR